MDELRSLCSCGAVARAVDLAFAHLADFGCDEDLLDLLAETMERSTVAPEVRRRFCELLARVSRSC